jgi:hypothetical protein
MLNFARSGAAAPCETMPAPSCVRGECGNGTTALLQSFRLCAGDMMQANEPRVAKTLSLAPEGFAYLPFCPRCSKPFRTLTPPSTYGTDRDIGLCWVAGCENDHLWDVPRTQAQAFCNALRADFD